MKLNWILIFCLAIVSFLYIYECSRNSKREISVAKKVDTIQIIKPIEKIIVKQAKAKIKYTRDTVIVFKPFEAIMDTILNKDTIQVKYFYPENLFDFRFTRQPDTLRIPFPTYIDDQKSKGWWKEPLLFATGVLLGYIIFKR
ncbi:MAG: hypothetical protein N2517_09030 [Ignavibacteria bacterium]|nr:hypothetical protein [Ignavibacteria bacterium]